MYSVVFVGCFGSGDNLQSRKRFFSKTTHSAVNLCHPSQYYFSSAVTHFSLKRLLHCLNTGLHIDNRETLNLDFLSETTSFVSIANTFIK